MAELGQSGTLRLWRFRFGGGGSRCGSTRGELSSWTNRKIDSLDALGPGARI